MGLEQDLYGEGGGGQIGGQGDLESALYGSAQQGQRTDVDAIRREVLAEMPWAQRQLVGAGGSLARGWEGLRGLVGLEEDQDVIRAADIASEEAPIGSIVGEAAKFAPVALAGSALLPAAGAAAVIGAATTPGGAGERLTTGAIEGGLTFAGGKLLELPAKMINKYGSNARAQRVLQKSIGSEADQVRAAQLARQAQGQPVTAAQATAALDNPVLASLDDAARGIGGEGADMTESVLYYKKLAEQQDAARLTELQKLARGATAAESAASRKTMKQNLEGALGPKRTGSLGAANASGQIDTNSILKSIQSAIDNPKTAGDKDSASVLKEVAKQINDWTKKGGGVIDAEALYRIREKTINQTIGRLLQGQNPKASQKAAARLSAEIRPLIDDAIENAGGAEWKQYLRKYSKGLAAVDRVELMDVARRVYETSPKKFMDLVKGESPKVIKKIMEGKLSLEDAVSPSTLVKLQKISGEVGRDVRLKDLAAMPEGKRALAKVLDQESLGRIPNLLNRYVAVANMAIKKGEMKVDQRLWKKIDEAMRNPKAFADLLEMLPAEQRSTMLGFIDKSLKTGAPQVGTAAVTGYGLQQ